MFAITLVALLSTVNAESPTDSKTAESQRLVRQYQQQRVDAIERVINSVVAIYDDDRAGGGSGVIISPSGLALTNHHVIMGAGIKGWGGLAGDKMFRWKLIGTDPGGDVSLIQMEGEERFPWSPLGDSDLVQVGDWALAMGNPFILTEDQSPTVTLGIVSGVKRYQHGAGKNQLVYGNCIQVDSSINPGNSGGPLFNFNGEVIGINGRGSFQDRGRVNVGLGYAISSNQIKNFIPDLMATKLTEHGTLDCNFTDRNGKVVCSTINSDSPAAKAGLALGDELVEFEGVSVSTANQFTNLICTLPESWPASLILQTPTGQIKEMTVRLLGLPYAKPKKGRNPRGDDGQPKEKGPPSKKEKLRQRKMEMIKLLSAKPGTVRNVKTNQRYTDRLVKQMRAACGQSDAQGRDLFSEMIDLMQIATPNAQRVMRTTLFGTRKWLIEQFETTDMNGKKIAADATPSVRYFYDGTDHFRINRLKTDEKEWEVQSLSNVEAKLELPMLQAMVVAAINEKQPLSTLGPIRLDGSDRCGRSNAFRFRIDDEDKDPLYLWAVAKPNDAQAAGELRKVSASMNCQEGGVAAGVTLEKWQQVGSMSIPLSRKFVAGLDEEVEVELVNLSAESLDGIIAATRLLKVSDLIEANLVEANPKEEADNEE
jgi:S1-C subfamily serine protease